MALPCFARQTWAFVIGSFSPIDLVVLSLLVPGFLQSQHGLALDADRPTHHGDLLLSMSAACRGLVVVLDH